MVAPDETRWPIEPHTQAKHVILRAYLDAWLPILSSRRSRLVYIDGFAGPGRYHAGEDGSPIVALKAAQQHSARLADDLVYFFIEEDDERAQSLRGEVAALGLPPKFEAHVETDTFETAIGGLLDALDAERRTLAPAFVFIDPFGITGIPFNLIERLLRQPQCEVLITLMTGSIRRWVTELPAQIGELFGNPDAARIIAGDPDRIRTARELYEASLKRAARFVRYFSMRNRADQPIYDLFFASNHPLGHYRMKEAMWKADGTGDLTFSDATDPRQTVLFAADPGSSFARALAARFKDANVDASVVLAYTRDETPFLEKHCRAALKLLEEGAGGLPKMSVDVTLKNGKKRRRGKFPEGTVLRFS